MVGRPRVYGNSSDRKAAQRARAKLLRGTAVVPAEQTVVEGEEGVPAALAKGDVKVPEFSRADHWAVWQSLPAFEAGASGEVEWEGTVWPVRRRVIGTEAGYVERSVREAGTVDRERLKRVRGYAAWRWRGYLVGAVASL